jgi:hypothetical protein
LVIEYWNLRFIWDLVLGICDFRHKTPRQSRRTLTYLSEPEVLSGQKMHFITTYRSRIKRNSMNPGRQIKDLAGFKGVIMAKMSLF